MSFILDALKKSETERQRQAAPGFADIPHGQDRPRMQRWLVLVIGLLAVNLAVLVTILFMREPAEESARIAQTAPPDSAAPAPLAAHETFSAIVAEAKRSRPEHEEPTTTEPPRSVAPSARTESPTAAGESAEPPAAAAATREPPPSTFDELRASGMLALPDLHLDIHVYSDNPEERFVFINMTRYRERANLKEGPLVREITADGVVLEQAGTTFLLPRQ